LSGGALGDEHPALIFPKDFDAKSVLSDWQNIERGDAIYVARDPLEVLKAYEGSITNMVAFVGDITADALQVLSLLMDELSIPSVDFL
jgi:hypothetical protein